MGRKLAARIPIEHPEADIDVVIPVPDSGRIAAMELAKELGVSFREGFVKNRYVGRTFIMPGQAIRKESVRKKLNPIPYEFEGKNVLLVDDSIVRGNTSAKIVEMARNAGAKRVYFASAAPPVIHPNVYGIDMPAREELVAHGRLEEEIADIIDADWLVYQTINDLKSSAVEGNPKISDFECSAFDGNYVTGDIDEDYLMNVSSIRNDAMKERRGNNHKDESSVLELHSHG